MILITIKNWDEYNPRKDVKSASWFRFDNSFFTNPTFFESSSDTKMVWCYLLCYASQKMKGEFKMDAGMIAALLRIEKKAVEDALAFLKKVDCIDFEEKETKASNFSTIEFDRINQSNISFSSATNERTNEHNERTNEDSETSSGTIVPPDLVIDYWNEFENLEKVKSKTPERKAKIKAASKKHDFLKTLEGFKAFFETVNSTPFLIGQNDRGWKANFDWVLKPANAVKIHEGNYKKLGNYSKAQAAQDNMLSIMASYKAEGAA